MSVEQAINELSSLKSRSMIKREKSDIICFLNGEALTYSYLVNACREIGLSNGDVILLHSSLLSLGEIDSTNPQKTVELFIRALQDVVGDSGTLILPTFTYSFLNYAWSGPAEPFDVNNSRSKTGVLSEFFRQQKDVVRTDHPTHSVAIWGNNKEYYSAIGNSTFGEDSIFGKLFGANAKIVCLGVKLPMTFWHFVERKVGVPYRETIVLSGLVINNKRRYQKEIFFYRRNNRYSMAASRLNDFRTSSVNINRATIGSGEISTILCRTVYSELEEYLTKDPYHFVKKSTIWGMALFQLKKIIKTWLRL